ncbi:hypothetical protein CHCC20335_3483 [Bacillus paralicheniformis]|nr:hypothetical protein CHCC20335_3483 [Bacillus paralicheniformis]
MLFYYTAHGKKHKRKTVFRNIKTGLGSRSRREIKVIAL